MAGDADPIHDGEPEISAKAEIWVVTGIDDGARSLARDAAGRAGMTPGAWVERAIGNTIGVVPPEAGAAHPDPDMIAALRAIGHRLDTSAERLRTRHEPTPDAPPAPVSMASNKTPEAAGGDTMPPGPVSRATSWGRAALAVGALAGVFAAVQTPAVRAVWDGPTDALSVAGRAPVKPLALPAATARDRTIAATLAAPAATEPAKALAALHDAARAGDARAQGDLGLLYATGGAVPRDGRRAAIWLHRAAAQNLPGAAYNLAVIYEQGLGVLRDRRKALRLYQRAAAHNHARARHNLAVALATGPGTPDFAEAAALLRPAAEAGLPAAQFGLGVLSEYGLGGPADRTAVIWWYRAATAGGYVPAAERLRRLTSQDPSQPEGAARPAIGEITALLRPLGFDPAEIRRVGLAAGAPLPHNRAPSAVVRVDHLAGENDDLPFLGSILDHTAGPGPSSDAATSPRALPAPAP